ncbi:tick legumain-like protein, partial [Leptotrombidium deliense]
NGTNWVVLVAGSNGYYNYRHQADICHAYHVIHDHGIPDENIIVMMYDDIANNELNPKKGFIRNKPNGPNVYPNVLKDYTGDEVSPQNFLGALSGSKALEEKGKKVVKSTAEDHIFVYFADHGAPGLIAFPIGELSATAFNKVLNKMYDENRYKKMVIYIEACESGSMFENLLSPNINIYATTAANSTESSLACYWDSELETYLGDVYSVKWIEDSDKPSLRDEKLVQQYLKVKKETNTSHVCEFGDMSMHPLPLSEFQGNKIAEKEYAEVTESPITDAVKSEDVPLLIAKHKAKYSLKNVRQYIQMVKGRRYMHKKVEMIAETISQFTDFSLTQLMNTKDSIKDHQCYDNLRETFKKHCFNFSKHPYALRYLYVLVNFCNSVNKDIEMIAKASKEMEIVCLTNNDNLFERIE